ncbi:transcriptional repressor LexA [Romboutsia sp. 1001713B170207_170306_H8]|uniref:transcriptional repressor LexA n=1 Tax=Romboutsia sp. 1001713B170207_170306_H8 TaxID=2787112 RepID=UPI001898F2CD|nr:transcriptional repressor LexA [Romboutsia sp. 1001713B170207_170306_H8]
MFLDLNNKQILILDFIRNHVMEKGYPPAVREICAALNIKSTSTVHSNLKKLEQLGYIKRDSEIPRGIEVLKKDEEQSHPIINLPLVGKVSAGTGIFAEENIEEFIPLPSGLVKGDENFILKIDGDSMIHAGILNGDYVIVDKKSIANNNQIVVALINNEYATVKRFFIEDTKIRLQPENDLMSPMYFDKHEIKILGIVTGVFRTIK